MFPLLSLQPDERYQVLDVLAKGAPGALLTEEAQAAVARLSKRATAT